MKSIISIFRIKNALRMSNYTQLQDYAGNNQSEWKAYRIALRELPDDPNWPDVEWPTIPLEPPIKRHP